MQPAPPLTGILETALYVATLPRARAFYEGVIGLSPVFADDRMSAYPVGARNVLLLFLRGATAKPIALPGGVIPPHDGAGALHFAFTIAAGDLAAWEARLAVAGVEVESRITWPRGNTSLSFRDPDGNLAELATPGLWDIW